MNRDLTAFQQGEFDLAIVGAGIHGAVLALAASRAGFRTALLEKGDFCQATSANSLKIIHGGIRYLQHGNFRRMRESILSRREMMAFAPHLVKPLPCLMPTYGHGLKGREMMRLAFAVYDAIAWDRNLGLPVANHLPGGDMLAAARVAKILPGLNPEGLTGGAVWHDAMALDSERLVLEYVKEAARYGAAVANYCQVAEIDADAGRVTGLRFRDGLDGGEGRFFCRAVVNATGPWQGSADGRSHQGWAAAVNIVVKKRLVDGYAVGLEGYTGYIDRDALIKRGKRLFFFVPWQGEYTMVGTRYTPHAGSTDTFTPSREMFLALLEEVNLLYPEARLKPEDLTFGHAGLLPMQAGSESQGDSVQLEKSSRIIDHGRENGPRGLYSVKGVKYTTAPAIAGQMVALLRDRLGFRRPGSYQAGPPRMFDFGAVSRRLGGAEAPFRALLRERYGSEWRTVFRQFLDERAMVGPDPLWFGEKPILLAAELLHFVREEMARHLTDVVFRRSNFGCAEAPEAAILAAMAELMGDELGWDEEERERQIEAVRHCFQPFQPEL
jgi:glycerol-3-phosphate dehydrogenase